MEESVLADPHKALPLDKKTPDPVTFDLPSQEVSRGDSLAAVAEQLPVASLLPQAVDQWVAGGYGAPVPLLASLSRRRSRGGGPGGLGRGCASIRLIQEDLLLSPSFMLSAVLFQSVDQSAGALSSSVSQGPPTLLLPPVKGPPGSRKKSSRHCYLCRKKTGLASSFQCRCGNSFCASHRYAEAHDCSFDYKSAGRRFLQETNPVVTAPKLPKI
ncbi:hypothetical protein ANANG_G00307330 [Anguilla anguilla]|uniref:AN1-type domain-containing protein n=1 Tax=Anguilla anguilla TaxID=7936 RepID=A0A9D3LS97_ANGAN|nr:hypothetical protein ANANG_G00307330 [Anguilla anguilla]